MSIEPGTSPKHRYELIKATLLVIVGALITITIVYSIPFFSPKEVSDPIELVTTTPEETTEPIVENTPTQDNIKVETSWKESTEYRKAVMTKVKYELGKVWNDSYIDIYEYPQNSGVYFYSTANADGRFIMSFDTNKNPNFMSLDNISVRDYETIVLQEKAIIRENDYDQYNIAGLDGTKLVFFNTSSMFSPGPCYSNWEYEKLSSIDLAQPNIKTPQSYTITKEKQSEIDEDKKKCIADLQ